MALTGAERTRHWRERERKGDVCLRSLTLPCRLVECMIDAAIISEDDSRDETKLGAALLTELNRSLSRRLADELN
jgi:hypothetical protein